MSPRYGTPSGGGLYTIKQDSPTAPVCATAPHNLTNEALNKSKHYATANTIFADVSKISAQLNTAATTDAQKYVTPQSRIPTNKQLSSSSFDGMNPNETGSRVPAYGSQQCNKAGAGSKLPTYASPDVGSRIPSLSSSGRSNSNLSNRYQSQEQHNNVNNNDPSIDRIGIASQVSSAIKPPSSITSGKEIPFTSRIPQTDFSTPPPAVNGQKPPVQTHGVRRTSPAIGHAGSGIRPPSKITPAVPLPIYSQTLSDSPTPGYCRPNSSLSNSDRESKFATHSNPRLHSSPYSPKPSIEYSEDCQRPPLHPSSAPYRISVGVTSPVNHAINTPGLPPCPLPGVEGRRPRPSMMPVPKAGSRIPQLGGQQ